MPGLVRYGHEIHHGEGAHDDAAGFRRTSAKNSWSPPSSRRSAPLDGPLRLQEECPPGQVKSRVANSDCSALGDRRDIGYTLLGGAPVPIAAPGHCRRRFSAPAPRAWVEKNIGISIMYEFDVLFQVARHSLPGPGLLAAVPSQSPTAKSSEKRFAQSA
jgi:hypothetical protein